MALLEEWLSLCDGYYICGSVRCALISFNKYVCVLELMKPYRDELDVIWGLSLSGDVGVKSMQHYILQNLNS